MQFIFTRALFLVALEYKFLFLCELATAHATLTQDTLDN